MLSSEISRILFALNLVQADSPLELFLLEPERSYVQMPDLANTSSLQYPESGRRVKHQLCCALQAQVGQEGLCSEGLNPPTDSSEELTFSTGLRDRA